MGFTYDVYRQNLIVGENDEARVNAIPEIRNQQIYISQNINYIKQNVVKEKKKSTLVRVGILKFNHLNFDRYIKGC